VRLRSAIDFIIPIPAFLFLRAAGLLGRPDRIAGYVIVAISISLAAATFALGPSNTYYLINNVIVIVALIALAVASSKTAPRAKTLS
jgi:hypothetical protein